MATYISKSNGFEQSETIARECPHCGANAQLIPVAAPSYATLVETRPLHAGVVFRCAACNEPRFVRLAVRGYEDERVELSSSVVEVERARERFQFGYLPADVERLLREALECYTADCYNAFALMSRRAVERALATLDASAPPRWHLQLKDVLRIAGVDGVPAQVLEAVLFGDERNAPEIGADEAAVLVEAVKDLFYQEYVRAAKLKAAMRMRRYFAGEGNVTPIERRRRERA